jgi:hypothetical protein
VVESTAAGLLALDDTVTWEARHLGPRRRLSVRITRGTRMRDVFEFRTIAPPLGRLLLAPHLRRFLIARNDVIRRVAQGDEWRRYLTSAAPTAHP